MITRKPEHLKSFKYLGQHRYFLTFCTDQRRKLFTDHASVNLVLSQILRAAADERFAVIAYCFMRDHLHLLVQGKDDRSDCLRFISKAKQLSGYHYAAAFRSRLWQRYGYERTLRESDATISVVKYILENPLRAKLVRRIDEYPFLGSETYSLAEIAEAVQWSPDRK